VKRLLMADCFGVWKRPVWLHYPQGVGMMGQFLAEGVEEGKRKDVILVLCRLGRVE
jgi:hypothetical protein